MRRALLFSLLLCSTLAHARLELPETDWLELMPRGPQGPGGDARDQPRHPGGGWHLRQQGWPQAAGQGPAGGDVFGEDRGQAQWPEDPYRGYPVPLETDAKGRGTLFFLVPYPGACIHVPPPPPNQIVLVRYPKGVALDDIYTRSGSPAR